MPIRPELRQFYGKVWRTETRPRILERAGHRCERCGKPDRAIVYVYCVWVEGFRRQYWVARGSDQWRDDRCRLVPRKLWPAPGLPRVIKIVLAVIHLNHVSGEDGDQNLRAFCQWCHLHHDKEQHRETRAERKDLLRPVLVAAMTEDPEAVPW